MTTESAAELPFSTSYPQIRRVGEGALIQVLRRANSFNGNSCSDAMLVARSMAKAYWNVSAPARPTPSPENMMKLVSKFALLLSAAALVTSSAVYAVADEKPKKGDKAKEQAAPKRNYSPEFRKAFAPALDLLNKQKDLAGSKAAFPAVVASIKNDDDRYEAGVFAINVGAQLKDMALQSEGIDLLLASATTPPSLKTEYTFRKGAIAYDAKDFVTAEKLMIEAYNAGHRANNIESLISSATSQQPNRETEAIAWLTKAIDASKAAGQPQKQYLLRAANLAAKAKDLKGAAGWYKELLKNEQTADSWHDALAFFDQSLDFNDEETLDLLRLMRATDGLRFQQEYGQYLDSLSYIGVRYPAEAVSVLDEGFAKGVISRNNVTYSERYNDAKAKLTDDIATLAGTVAPAKASPKGILASLTGDSFYSHKNYVTAKELYEAALAKGPVVDKDGADQTDRTRFRLAMSKVMLNDYAGAKADFALITGANRKAIAEYWLMYIDQKSAVAATPAAAPATTG